MGIWGKISGKALQDKVNEYSEVYGEVLLGLHRDLEKQNGLLQDCQQHLDSQIQLLKEQEKQVTALAGSLRDLHNRHEQFELKATTEFVSLHSTVEQFQSEASALAATRENLTQLAQDLKQKGALMQNGFAAQAKQIQHIRFLCILSYIFALAIGWAVWLIR
jgi:predicted RNase H-like nuclease (RuvC/YqgF family)